MPCSWVHARIWSRACWGHGEDVGDGLPGALEAGADPIADGEDGAAVGLYAELVHPVEGVGDDPLVELAAHALVGAEDDGAEMVGRGLACAAGLVRAAFQGGAEAEEDGAVVVLEGLDGPLVLADAHRRQRLHRPHHALKLVRAVDLPLQALERLHARSPASQ